MGDNFEVTKHHHYTRWSLFTHFKSVPIINQLSLGLEKFVCIPAALEVKTNIMSICNQGTTSLPALTILRSSHQKINKMNSTSKSLSSILYGPYTAIPLKIWTRIRFSIFKWTIALRNNNWVYMNGTKHRGTLWEKWPLNF